MQMCSTFGSVESLKFLFTLPHTFYQLSGIGRLEWWTKILNSSAYTAFVKNKNKTKNKQTNNNNKKNVLGINLTQGHDNVVNKTVVFDNSLFSDMNYTNVY